MAVVIGDVILTHPISHSPDHRSKIGGKNSYASIIGSEVNNIFLPGMIKNSEFSDTNYYQYTKLFIFNSNSTDTMYDTRIYGYNTKRNNIVSFALERDINGNLILDGEETIKNRIVEPSFDDYSFIEAHSDNAIDAGINGDGELPPLSGQGVWLKMECNLSDTEDALDNFKIGVKFKTEE